MSPRVLIYYKYQRHTDRWFRGDRFLRAPIRRVIRGPDRPGGLDLVFINLCAGLQELGIEFHANLPFREIRPDDKVGVIGRDAHVLKGYSRPNAIVAGVAVTQHPDEWPSLFQDYPVSRYVVHSEWVAEMFRRVYGDVVSTWAVGIDTERWRPSPNSTKTLDILLYDKVQWSHDRVHSAMVEPIERLLAEKGLRTATLRYGSYTPSQFSEALARSRAMLFLSEHETQGLAYQQALSAGVPILAWDPGQWLDPWRFRYSGPTIIPSKSVPFFDHRCGLTFGNFGEFKDALEEFMTMLSENAFTPRSYVEETLTLKLSARRYLDILDEFA